jgi:peptide/nickel transport system substrate-binding protein
LQVAMNLPANDIAAVGKGGAFTQLTVPSIGTPLGLPINVTKPPTDDLRVRQAILYGVDQDKMVKDIQFGVNQPAHNVLTPITPGYSTAAAKRYSYDPAKAESLLDAAGWLKGANGIRRKDGKALSLDILLFSGAGLELPVQFVVSELSKIGFTAHTTVQPFATASASYNKGVQNLASFGYYGEDPYLLNIWVNSDAIKSGFNSSHYDNPEVDSTIARANSTANDAKRDALYENVGDMLMEDAMFLPLWDVNGAFTASSRLTGLKPTLNGYILFHAARMA